MTHKIEIPEAFTPNYAQCFDDFDRKTERRKTVTTLSN